jgi:thiol-disulfide isomerase/thioredoxin
MKKIFFLAILLPALTLFHLPAYTQSVSSSGSEDSNATPVVHPALKIGDTIPNLFLSNILNHKSGEAYLQSFKSKLIILDFFASWCGACLQELPRIDSLQKQLPGTLQVIAVCYQPKAVIQSFLKTNKKAGAVSVPFITADTVLKQLFPHTLLPHQIWIDQSGKVIAIAKPKYATAQNINAYINAGSVNLPVKNDNLLFDRSRSLSSNMEDSKTEVVYNTSLTGHFEGVASMTGIQNIAGTGSKRLYYINQSIISLYLAALGYEYENRVLLQVHNINRFVSNSQQDSWSDKNTFCYEQQVPETTPVSSMKNWLAADLDRWFNTHATIEKRLVKCYVLTAIPGAQGHFKSSGAPPKVQWASATAPVTILQNQPLEKLTTAINKHLSAKPFNTLVINETGYTGNVDISLISPLSDLGALSKEVKQFGLQLLPAQRELSMLVITENPSTQSN